jgi:hypothetical protein
MVMLPYLLIVPFARGSPALIRTLKLKVVKGIAATPDDKKPFCSSKEAATKSKLGHRKDN